MSTTVLILLLVFIVFVPVLLIAAMVFFVLRQRKQVLQQTWPVVSDRDLLHMIQQQPDGLLTAHQLADTTPLTLQQARIRLTALYYFGALSLQYGAGMRHHYSLESPIAVDERAMPSFSDDPFLTVEDILLLFRHFDFQVRPVDLLAATGLPLPVLKRELKYFRKEKIITTLTASGVTSNAFAKTYVLCEPYRSHPEQFLDRKLDLDARVKQMLRKEDLV